jgi:hypothetical protein
MDSSAAQPQLTASELIGESWSFLKGHPGSLAIAAAFPLVLSVFVGVVLLAATRAELSPQIVAAAQSLLDVLPWTFFGVAWHRLILSSEAATASIEWSNTHTRFAAFLLAWRVPYLFVSTPAHGSDFYGLFFLVFITAAIALSYIQARFSLFLPAAAISQPISPANAWSMSKGCGGAIFWAGVLAGMFSLLLCIPLIAAVAFLQAQSSTAAELALVPLNCAMQLVFEALAVGALSFAYKAICAHARAG